MVRPCERDGGQHEGDRRRRSRWRGPEAGTGTRRRPLCALPRLPCAPAHRLQGHGTHGWEPLSLRWWQESCWVASPQRPLPEVTVPVTWHSPHSHLGLQVEVAPPPGVPQPQGWEQHHYHGAAGLSSWPQRDLPGFQR